MPSDQRPERDTCRIHPVQIVGIPSGGGIKKELSTTRFVRAARKRHSKERTADKIEELLTRYFSTHETMSRWDFQVLCGFRKATANRRLAELVKAKKLRKEGLYRFPVYVPAEGYFGK